MEPVLTQEELEAIYSAMQADSSQSAAVDEIALTSSREFISQAKKKWTEATLKMAPRLEGVLTGALGRRVKLDVHQATAIEQEDGEEQDWIQVGDESFVVLVISIGEARLLLGIDHVLARRYIERRTGAQPDLDDQQAVSTNLTTLENRIFSDLVADLAAVAAEVVQGPKKASVEKQTPKDFWERRTPGEPWIEVQMETVSTPQTGVWFRGPASVFLEMPIGSRRMLADHLATAKIEISVELGKTSMKVSELLDLKPGALIPLGVAVGDPIHILVGGIPKLNGEPMVSRGNIAVRVLDRLRSGVPR